MDPIIVGPTSADADPNTLSVDVHFQQAQWHQGFRIIGDPDHPTQPDSAVALTYDQTHLHIGLRAYEPQMDSVRARGRRADEEHGAGMIHGDDRFEIFIDSENLARSFAYLVVNRHEALLSWWCEGHGHRNWAGPTDWHCAESPDGWSVRLSIPFHRFQYNRRSTEAWSINVMRARVLDIPGHQSQLSTLVPLTGPGKLFNPTSFRPIVLDQFSQDRYLWSVRPLGRKRFTPADRQYRLEQPIRIEHLAAAKTNVTVTAQATIGASQANPSSVDLSLVGSQTHDESLCFSVPEPACGELTIRIKDGAAGELLHETSISIDAETLSWKSQVLLQQDGQGGHTARAADIQVLPRIDGMQLWPFGLSQMDNGEIVLLGTARNLNTGREQAHIGFSNDGGANWTSFEPIPVPDAFSRPMMVTYLGNGVLTFNASEGKYKRYFSHDFGRNWDEIIPLPHAANGLPFQTEGNPLVDRDDQGRVLRIAEIGCNVGAGGYPQSPFYAELRWSSDGGRTWSPGIVPTAWNRPESWHGRTYTRGVSEGSVIRAANGWVVAALRTDMPARYFTAPNMGDALEGTAVSISKDDGQTWSDLVDVFEPGRHHGNLVRLSNGDLVLTVIRRIDIRNGRLASYRRGCDAVISHDHGLTWQVDRMYTLDEFNYCSGTDWVDAQCGHVCSIALDDDTILTTYGNYQTGALLIRWRP